MAWRDNGRRPEVCLNVYLEDVDADVPLTVAEARELVESLLSEAEVVEAGDDNHQLSADAAHQAPPECQRTNPKPHPRRRRTDCSCAAAGLAAAVLPARSSAAAPVAFFCTEAIARLESVLSRPRYRRADAARTWSMRASVLLRSAGSATLGRRVELNKTIVRESNCERAAGG